MDEARNRSLSTSRLAQNQHGYVRLREQLSLRPKLLHGGTDAKEELVFAERLYIFTRHLRLKAIIPSTKMATDNGFNLGFAERPDQNIFCSETGCFFLPVSLFGIANHHDRKVRPQPPQPGQEVKAIAVSARNIQ